MRKLLFLSYTYGKANVGLAQISAHWMKGYRVQCQSVIQQKRQLYSMHVKLGFSYSAFIFLFTKLSMKWVVWVMCPSSRGQQVLELRCTNVCCSIHWWRWSWGPWHIFHPWVHTGRAGRSSSHTTPHGSLLKVEQKHQLKSHTLNKPHWHVSLCLCLSRFFFSVLIHLNFSQWPEVPSPFMPTARLDRQSCPGGHLMGNLMQSRGEMVGNTQV